MSGILVWIETHGGDFRKATREAAGAAVELAQKISADVSGALIGSADMTDRAGELGLSKVFVVDDPAVAEFSSEAYTEALAKVMEASGADIVLMGATALGRDVSARLAARMDAALATDIIRIDSESPLMVTRPVYSGKLLAETELKAPVKVISLRPNVFPAYDGEPAKPEIVKTSLEELAIRAKVKQAIETAQGELDVTEAEIIVSGGRGVKGPEGFTVIENLAKTLGAAVGASRAAVDAGWIPYKHQVGQTGKVVSPVLYIACGISGAIQHFAGMGSSKFIIAVNTDPDAPIMQKADFAIVGDLFKVVPILQEELSKVLNK